MLRATLGGILTDGAWDHASDVEGGLARAAVDGVVDGVEDFASIASDGLDGSREVEASHCFKLVCCSCYQTSAGRT